MLKVSSGYQGQLTSYEAKSFRLVQFSSSSFCTRKISNKISFVLGVKSFACSLDNS